MTFRTNSNCIQLRDQLKFALEQENENKKIRKTKVYYHTIHICIYSKIFQTHINGVGEILQLLKDPTRTSKQRIVLNESGAPINGKKFSFWTASKQQPPTQNSASTEKSVLIPSTSNNAILNGISNVTIIL